MLLQVRLLLLVAGPAYCLAEDWLTFGHDPQKSAHVAGNSVVRMCGNAIACHRRTSSINFVVCSASVSSFCQCPASTTLIAPSKTSQIVHATFTHHCSYLAIAHAAASATPSIGRYK